MHVKLIITIVHVNSFILNPLWQITNGMWKCFDVLRLLFSHLVTFGVQVVTDLDGNSLVQIGTTGEEGLRDGNFNDAIFNRPQVSIKLISYSAILNWVSCFFFWGIPKWVSTSKMSKKLYLYIPSSIKKKKNKDTH
jgi:hypothetical protein